MESNKNSNNQKLSTRQLLALPHILSAPTLEEAGKRASISPKQIHEWMKDPTFQTELQTQRNSIFCNALASLKTGSQKASQTLIELLDNKDPRIRLLASEKILSYAFKSIELLELDERISALESLSKNLARSDHPKTYP